MLGLGGGGSGGGDDRLLVGIGITCAIYTVVVTLLLSILLPANVAADYSFEQVYNEREALSQFNGESLTANTPWTLQNVYTPWDIGDDYQITESGWIYGSKVNPYTLNGETYCSDSVHKSIVKLDPQQKSSTELWNSKEDVTITVHNSYGLWQDVGTYLVKFFTFGFIDLTPKGTHEEEVTYPAWNFTGYRYEFKPMLPFRSNEASSDGELSIVWYKLAGSGAEGLSGGLVIYGKDNVLLASYSAVDIVADYNIDSTYSTKYTLDFEGTPVDLNIRFDPEVLAGNVSPEQGWKDGKWSLAISTVSAGQFIDLANSSNYSTSVGNMLDTFFKIYRFDMPTSNPYYSFVLWIMVALPAQMAILLFSSRFGIAGIGAGLLGSALLFLG